jgi:predicted metal-binding protein
LMSAIETDLEMLTSRALELGAYRAKSIHASEIVIDPRVRLKCSVPLCDNYGRNRMCPPNTISVDEFAKVLSRYRFGLLVQFEIAYSEEDIKKKFKCKPLKALQEDARYVDEMTNVMRHMSGTLSKLEKEALYMGYRFAAALSGGCCKLCDECVGPGPDAECRHPFQARPSMEAVGVDVIATAKNVGLKVDFPVKNKAIWTGLLLVD